LVEPLGHFTNQEVPPGIVGIQHGDAFPARERFRRLLLEEVQLRGVLKLFDRLHRAVLLLEQVGVPRHSLRRLCRGLEEAAVERHSLPGVAVLHQPVELQPVEMRRALRIVLLGIQVAERLEGVQVRRIGAVNLGVGFDGVIELVPLDALLGLRQQFFEVDSHQSVSGTESGP
jgi:hypothetical protein